ncbi:MAG: hypothetical protein ACYCZX_06185 [Rhodospirillaceae bacterium]
MSETEDTIPVTWAHRLRIFMLAVVALAFVTAVVKVFQGEGPPLWWLYLVILAVLGVLAWIESTWAVFAFALYIAAYKFLWIFATDENYLAKGVVAGGIVLACGGKYVYDRRKRRAAKR